MEMNQEQISDLQWKIEDNVALYIDEWVMDKLERIIDEKIAELADGRGNLVDEIKEELVYEMYKLKKELEDKIEMNSKVAKKSFWKWWK